ncbi:Flavin-dependent oxidoreductase, luciferase family (includes alkanesulfonate monooxygenase SsuD and methylene tetrahydromethanopterin reductase) [Asanoa hainanensis]|uniref:Flavin-dependent oxidoreductase, luciferase family (Includes alkanesulfonate monooxygenase SsuD and methylene tetrahydromethanopterin reductase) n=1 Tax=Asanoa hainanensis TaxID=560556 RepID=A0A239N0Q3_9ACTN|nr:LLM class flavin-dependent oxidoreductase [Asanoa hainanensis]SNT48536.1 Flavin-dependent oxidoreductase, luciferase family (includes alkanesulfonate monooxygenase SsuD and methylene tetrahydromethanopterin reductase) [Asanoa hainanensis]
MAERDSGAGLAVSAVVDGSAGTTRGIVAMAASAEKHGMHGVWLPQLPNQLDMGTLQVAIAMATDRVTVGTAILPMYSRPPVVMAQATLTADELAGGRLVLGLGLGHRGVGDWMVGGEPMPALPATREYLTIVTSLIQDGEVSVDGRWHSGRAAYTGHRRADLPVYLGAFGPRMLELAGEQADGAILWMCDPRYVAEQAMPALRRGWQRRGGRPAGFRVVAMLQAADGPDPAADRRLFARRLSSYLRVATYRRLFERSGFGAAVAAGRPDDAMVSALSAFGTDEIAQRLVEYRSAGVDEIAVAPAGAAGDSPDGIAAIWSLVRDLARETDRR